MITCRQCQIISLVKPVIRIAAFWPSPNNLPVYEKNITLVGADMNTHGGIGIEVKRPPVRNNKRGFVGFRVFDPGGGPVSLVLPGSLARRSNKRVLMDQSFHKMLPVGY